MTQTQVGFADAHTTVVAPAGPVAPRTVPPAWNLTASRVYEPPTAADLQRERAEAERQRLARRRPADKSPAAVQAALDNVTLDLATATATVSRRQDEAAEALATGTPADVKANRDALELAQIEVDQLTAMAAGLHVSLERAEAEEAAELARLAERAKDAAATVARFRAFLDRDYPKHAAAIGKGMALEREAEAAMGTLRAASTYLGHDAPEPLPRVPNGTVREAYRFRACLPGTDVRPIAAWAPVAPAIQY